MRNVVSMKATEPFGKIISGLRVSDELHEALRTDFQRRTRRDKTRPDKYNWSDHLRFLLQKGMEHADY